VLRRFTIECDRAARIAQASGLIAKARVACKAAWRRGLMVREFWNGSTALDCASASADLSTTPKSFGWNGLGRRRSGPRDHHRLAVDREAGGFEA
jgi:hypothetical protein